MSSDQEAEEELLSKRSQRLNHGMTTTMAVLEGHFVHAPIQQDEQIAAVPAASQQQLVPQTQQTMMQANALQDSSDQINTLEESDCPHTHRPYSNEYLLMTSPTDQQVLDWYQSSLQNQTLQDDDLHLSADQQLNEERTMQWFDVEAVYFAEMEDEEDEKIFIQMLYAIASMSRRSEEEQQQQQQQQQEHDRDDVHP